MNCPICKTVVAKLPEQLHGRHCKCPKDEHVGLLLELFETLEHRADKLNDARRMLDLRESQLADCTRVMREVSGTLRAWEKYMTENAPTSIDQKRFGEQAKKLDAARAGKAAT